MSDARARWNQQYDEGRWAFLSDPSEHLRLNVVAGMIAGDPKIDIIDLGSGPGHLLASLTGAVFDTYVAVDISDVALAQIDGRGRAVETVRSSLGEFSIKPGRRCVVIANEVLYYEDDNVEHLARIVGECRLVERVIVSAVGPHADKPNWTKASRAVWSRVEAIGWRRTRSVIVRDEDRDRHWDIVEFDPRSQ